MYCTFRTLLARDRHVIVSSSGWFFLEAGMAGPCLWEWEKEELDYFVGLGWKVCVQGCDGASECFR
jgi:hypothetical protein